MLAKGHYQFVALVPFAAWALWQPAELGESATKRISRWLPPLLLVMLMVALFLLVLASWKWSPWAAMLSLLFAGLPMLWWVGRDDAVRRGFRAWIFCWVMLPLPFGMDADLTVWLRGLATQMTSGTLDQMGVLHLCYANVIEVPAKALFVADACSGINSLFTLMACALFLAMWFQRSIIHSVVLLLASFGLVMVENTTRLLTVVVALGWETDLSTGWKHQALGAVLFLISVGLLLSVDQLVYYFVGNLSGPRRIRPRRGTLDSSGPTTYSNAFFAAAFCFPVLAGAQLWRAPSSVPEVSALWQADIQLDAFGANTLPEKLAGFDRVDYKTIERVVGDPLGRSSQQWTYRRGFTTATVSLDYPYDGIHDLCVCYSQIGWQIHNKRVLSPDELNTLEADPNPVLSPAAMGQMSRNMYGNGLLMFSLCDTEGRMGAVIKELARGTTADRMMARYGARGSDPESGQFDEGFGRPPYLQFQLLARTHEEIDASEIRGLTELFVSARGLLRERCLRDLNNEAGAR
ncbi:MAG: exosortase [Pirellulaceae bacterium]|jgi:exosortase